MKGCEEMGLLETALEIKRRNEEIDEKQIYNPYEQSLIFVK